MLRFCWVGEGLVWWMVGMEAANWVGGGKWSMTVVGGYQRCKAGLTEIGSVICSLQLLLVLRIERGRVGGRELGLGQLSVMYV